MYGSNLGCCDPVTAIPGLSFYSQKPELKIKDPRILDSNPERNPGLWTSRAGSVTPVTESAKWLKLLEYISDESFDWSRLAPSLFRRKSAEKGRVK